MLRNNELINNVLKGIERSIADGVFVEQEYGIVELKGLSNGLKGDSWKQTVCAFLNTEGGFLIIGVTETQKPRAYMVTGFDRKWESEIIKYLKQEEHNYRFLKDDRGSHPDLTEYISMEYFTLCQQTVLVLMIRPLSEDLKYILLGDVGYERVLERESKISQAKINRQREYKAELEYSKEISTVPKSTLEELDINKINDFIYVLRERGSNETLKKELSDAVDFLVRRHFLSTTGETTFLGLLLFGKEPEIFLENRAGVDCYYDTGNSIARDKKYYRGDVLTLMKEAFTFVWSHINVGRSHVGGGRSEPEFPEELVREVINNALAHRDYTINRFSSVKIKPEEHIEIINPGRFRQRMVVDTSGDREIRRVIPGFSETPNPKLAAHLQGLEKMELQGIGMATLVSECLKDKIDVPYYDLSIQDSISLVIPSGKLLDDNTQRWINSFKGYLNKKLYGRLTREHELVLAYLLKSERLNQKRKYTILLSPSNNHFQVLEDLKIAGLIQEHSTASTEQTPIFVLNEELTYKDFYEQLEQLFGKELFGQDVAKNSILNIIYRYNRYNEEPVKPSIITPELYNQLYGKEIDPTKYESLGRKVRKICSDLATSGVLKKASDNAYTLVRV